MSADPNLSQSPASAGPLPAAERPGPGPMPRLHARRVVIACAEPQLGESVERVLRHHADDVAPEGLEFRRVHDGLTCLQDIQLTRPSLLVLHARLDRMSPDEILQAWDATHPGDSLPVLVLSSQFGRDVPRGMPGAVVLNLPFDNNELVAIVARALETERASGA